LRGECQITWAESVRRRSIEYKCRSLVFFHAILTVISRALSIEENKSTHTHTHTHGSVHFYIVKWIYRDGQQHRRYNNNAYVTCMRKTRQLWDREKKKRAVTFFLYVRQRYKYARDCARILIWWRSQVHNNYWKIAELFKSI